MSSIGRVTHIPTDNVKPGIFILGKGAVGSALWPLVNNNKDVIILGRADSKNIYWPTGQVQTDYHWNDLKQMLIQRTSRYHVILVDVSGAIPVAQDYDAILRSGIHIVTASKIAESRSQRYYNVLQQISADGSVYFKKETTVLAGLPVLSTISNVLRSGDQIHRIEGVFSGTLTYIFSELQRGKAWSDVVQAAKLNGYSEPDPRDDLYGEDVARKCLILSRLLGWAIEREELQVENLAGEDCQDISGAQFLNELYLKNKEWSSKIENAKQRGNVLRYVSTIEKGSVRSAVQEVPLNSPLGNLSGTENIIRIYTDRYREIPITISGPGAGRAVTASGVYINILEIIDSMNTNTIGQNVASPVL